VQPNYNLIYQEMLLSSAPEKLENRAVKSFLENSNKKAIDLISINHFIAAENIQNNKKWQVYDEASIKEILNYQQDHELSNNETAKLYNISLISLRKWKKHFSQPLPKGGEVLSECST
jgi:DNA-binding transcriptional regulator YiaG